MMRGPFTFPIARAVRSVLLAGTEDELTVELACCRAEHSAVVDVLRQTGWRDISRPPAEDVEALALAWADAELRAINAAEALAECAEALTGVHLERARAARDVERDASPVDGIADFARRELDLELAPWQLEVLGLLVAGERPNEECSDS